MDTLSALVAAYSDGWLFVWVLAGVGWGILGGALPGISPSVTMALLLPVTYSFDPEHAVVLLASSYVGAEFGGSIPAILIRTPGTNAAAATVADGYQMRLQGKADVALGISLYSGFLGSLLGVFMLILLAQPLSNLALHFTPPAYFALGLLGLSAVVSFSGASLIKGMVSVFLGLTLATVGTDPVSGSPRLTFGAPELLNGLAPVTVMIGVFAMSELLVQVSASERFDSETIRSKVRITFPDRTMRRGIWPAQSIGGVIGTIEGILPGVGGTVASFMSYSAARLFSRNAGQFGKGSPEGIAAPETANNTVASTTLIPMLSLGIPGSNSAAVLLGGFLLHGLVPGPMLAQSAPEVVYSLFAGLLFAAFALVILGVMMLPVCILIVNQPRAYLNAVIFALILSGVYTIGGSLFDVGVMLASGALGFFMRRHGFPLLPMILGLILGYLIESNFRRSLLISGNDYSIFWNDKIAFWLIVTSAVSITASLVVKKASPSKS